MNKAELISHLTGATGETKVAVTKVVDALTFTAQNRLGQGQEFALHGIGKLVPVQRPARMGRNPRTGEPTPIPARTAIKFKPSAALK